MNWISMTVRLMLPLVVFFLTTVSLVNTLIGLKKLDSELNNRPKIADQGEFSLSFKTTVMCQFISNMTVLALVWKQLSAVIAIFVLINGNDCICGRLKFCWCKAHFAYWAAEQGLARNLAYGDTSEKKGLDLVPVEFAPHWCLMLWILTYWQIWHCDKAPRVLYCLLSLMKTVSRWSLFVYSLLDVCLFVYLCSRRVCRVLSTSEEEGTEPAQPGPSSPQRQPKVKKESKKNKKPAKKKKVSSTMLSKLSCLK